MRDAYARAYGARIEHLHDLLLGIQDGEEIVRVIGATPAGARRRADGRRLGERLAEWGRYYESAPRVVALDVAEVCRAARRSSALAAAFARRWAEAESPPGVSVDSFPVKRSA